MMKKVIEELKKQEMSVGKEEKPYKLTATHVRIGGLEAKGTEEKILGHPISKKAPHSMLGKKLEREL